MIAFYGRTLKFVLRYQTITLLVALATLVLTIFLYIVIPKGFFPVQDTGVIQGISQAPNHLVYGDGEEAAGSGQGHPAGSRGREPFLVHRRGWHQHHAEQRTHVDQPEAARPARPQRLRRDSPAAQQASSRCNGITLYMQPVQNITVDDRVSRTQYQYTLEDPDMNELNQWTNRFVAKLKQLPELADVATDQQTGGLSVSLIIDRVTASRLGIAPSTIDNTLYDAFGQRQINTMYTQLNQYHVILEAQPKFQQDPDKLNKIYIQANASSGATGAARQHFLLRLRLRPRPVRTRPPSPSLYALVWRTYAASRMRWPQASSSHHRLKHRSEHHHQFHPSNAVPLSAFTHFEPGTEALSINHQGQFPAVTVSFNLAPNAALGSAITAIDKVGKDMNLPASLQADFQGTAASFKNSLSNEALLILAALVTVYIVLGVLYESFIHPITILSTLPSAGVGALLALILFRPGAQRRRHHRHHPADRHREEERHHDGRLRARRRARHGKNSTDAIYEACLLRFRPIMMTTMAALLGGIPLAFGHGHRFGAAPSAGHRHGRRLAAQPGAHALHHAGHLHLLRQPGAEILPRSASHPAQRPSSRQPAGKHEHLRAIHPPAGRHHAADDRDRHRRGHRLQRAAGLAAAAGGFSHHLRPGRPARRQRGDHGVLGCHSAGAPVRPHRRRHRDDLVEFARQHSVTLQFDLSRNIDGAARDVEAAINAARTYLPANLPGNPTYRKVNPADAPIMIIGLTSDKYDRKHV